MGKGKQNYFCLSPLPLPPPLFLIKNGFFTERRAAPLADGSAQVRGRRDPPDLARARPDRSRFEPWDWDIIRKGSKLGFRTLAVPEGMGRARAADFVTQALVMAELAQRRQRDLQSFQPELEVEPSDRRGACTDDQKERFLKPFLADDTLRDGARHHRTERRIGQPPAARGRPQGGLPAPRGAQRRRVDPERREMLHRERQRRQALFSSTRARTRT